MSLRFIPSAAVGLSALAATCGFRSLAVDCSAGATIPKLKFIMAKNRNQCYIYSKH